jgi:hypothetical protein
MFLFLGTAHLTKDTDGFVGSPGCKLIGNQKSTFEKKLKSESGLE